jgi:hypothetical protein
VKGFLPSHNRRSPSAAPFEGDLARVAFFIARIQRRFLATEVTEDTERDNSEAIPEVTYCIPSFPPL